MAQYEWIHYFFCAYSYSRGGPQAPQALTEKNKIYISFVIRFLDAVVNIHS